MTNQEKRMKQIGFILIGVAMLTQPLFAQQTKELDILHTSDTHSRIEPIDPQAADKLAGLGGVLRRVAFVKQFRQEHPDMLLFDGGDFSQGTPYYNLFWGELEVQMMNLMRYDAVTIGNHEFDFGLENMARLYRMARFPVVCANYDVKGTVLEGLVKPYVVLERGGLRIGVFGLSPQLEGLVQASRCEGVVYQDPVATAQAVVDTLRGAERCDVVICLSHLGLLGIDSEVPGDEVLAARTRGIDLILGGHTHTFLEQPAWLPDADGKHVPLMHTGKNGAYVGQLKMRLEKE